MKLQLLEKKIAQNKYIEDIEPMDLFYQFISFVFFIFYLNVYSYGFFQFDTIDHRSIAHYNDFVLKGVPFLFFLNLLNFVILKNKKNKRDVLLFFTIIFLSFLFMFSISLSNFFTFFRSFESDLNYNIGYLLNTITLFLFFTNGCLLFQKGLKKDKENKITDKKNILLYKKAKILIEDDNSKQKIIENKNKMPYLYEILKSEEIFKQHNLIITEINEVDVTISIENE